MKNKNYWLISLCFVLPSLILALETNFFLRPRLYYSDLILPVILLAGGMVVFVRHYIVVPTENFMQVINRAIHGDYRARFSCDDENQGFKRLSRSFNQFMIITERQTEELAKNRHLQNQLYENERVYRSALELTCERVFEADLTHNRLIYGLDLYMKEFPFITTGMYDHLVTQMTESVIHEDDAKEYYRLFNRESLMESFLSGITEVMYECRQKMCNGEIRWVSISMIHLSDSDNDDVKLIGYVKNVDERKRHELDILKQSQKDGLTGLYNKKCTQNLIETFLQGEGATGIHAIIMVDIDNFKRINDTLGHIQGDYALMRIGEKLQGMFRNSDVVGRIGGDEFLILMKNYDTYNLLLERLNGLCNMFKGIKLGEDASYPVSGSIGVSRFPDDGKSYVDLYKKADISLYYAKARGKNCFYLYSGHFGNSNGAVPVDCYELSEVACNYTPSEKPIDVAPCPKEQEDLREVL